MTKKETKKVIEAKSEIAKEAPKEEVDIQKNPLKYDEYKALIEAYKKKDPVKYEMKKEVLEARLKALK